MNENESGSSTTPVEVSAENDPKNSPPVDAPVPTPAQPVDAGVGVAEADADDSDVEAALARETDDGSGFEEGKDESTLPESDFAGFAEDDVEVTE